MKDWEITEIKLKEALYTSYENQLRKMLKNHKKNVKF